MNKFKEREDAANAMQAAGYQVDKYRIYPVYNNWGKIVYCTVVKYNGILGMLIYTPEWDDKPVKFKAF